ncbi:MAG: hypothetical protein HKN33_15505 [Pyrinomonadaceae bacterium]|nr:hypothetical protein [Pyrinomonadaceae bacterium]
MYRSRLLIYICIVFAAAAAAGIAQTPQPTPTPFGQNETPLEKIRRQDREHQRLQQEVYNNLYGQDALGNSSRFTKLWRAKMVELYREPGKKETRMLAPENRYTSRYSEFLKNDDAGIFRLIPDQGCDQKGSVSAAPKCLKYNFPGAGSSYSFRLGSYRLRRLADISYFRTTILTRGVLSGAIFVALGDIPVEAVTLETRGISFLSEYKPAKTAEKALEAAKRFAKGVKNGGFVYGRGVYATPNTTFAMRLIAYRGKYLRVEDGVKYNELDFDKRRDIIVTFRVLDVDRDGTATIVWKILRESKAPKIKMPRPKSK